MCTPKVETAKAETYTQYPGLSNSEYFYAFSVSPLARITCKIQEDEETKKAEAIARAEKYWELYEEFGTRKRKVYSIHKKGIGTIDTKYRHKRVFYIYSYILIYATLCTQRVWHVSTQRRSRTESEWKLLHSSHLPSPK